MHDNNDSHNNKVRLYDLIPELKPAVILKFDCPFLTVLYESNLGLN